MATLRYLRLNQGLSIAQRQKGFSFARKASSFPSLPIFRGGGRGGGEVSGGRDERAALVALEFCIIEGAGSLAFKRNVSKMETF